MKYIQTSWYNHDHISFHTCYLLTRNSASCSFHLQVFDATNTTMLRRRLIFEKVVVEMEYKLFYVESICDDPSIIESNIRVSPGVHFQHFELIHIKTIMYRYLNKFSSRYLKKVLLPFTYLCHHLIKEESEKSKIHVKFCFRMKCLDTCIEEASVVVRGKYG